MIRVCCYEDRPVAMDSLVLMGESLCRSDPEVSLHLTVPDAPAEVRAWAQRRPEVILSTTRPPGLTGWDVKPWLLLQQLNEGSHEALWLDDDMIVSSPLSSMLRQFPPDALIVAQEWDGTEALPLCRFWDLPLGRRIPAINACVLRVNTSHRPLLERYLRMTQEPRYREVQSLPIASRPIAVLGDTPLLMALLQSEEFSQVPFDYLRLGRDIAQCAGSSGYRTYHRLLDLSRGLPPLIHGLGRKPWDPAPEQGRVQAYLLDLATDVSPYVLAARSVARDLGMAPKWLEARTSVGAALRGATACHPGMAGLPLAILHELQMRLTRQHH